MDDATDFQQLRRKGIAFAQELSGGVWTDFNTHDPGVTLLEAFCYALTEIGYRADFPTADLLTGPDGRLDLRRLRLGEPRSVLPTRPVTARDLALTLSDADPAVERVLVHPRSGAAAGLYDLHVVPEADSDPAQALAAVRRAFHANRNLCEDLGSLALAVPVPCRLEARIEVRRRVAPERVAALVYDRCGRLMRDRGAARPRAAATRADVFDDPARIYGHLADPAGGAASLDGFFAELTGLDEVEDVTALAFRRVDAPERDPFGPLARGEYRALVLPERPEDVGLVLASRDLLIPFDLTGMRAELARLRADHVARLSDPLDRRDWAPVAPGRRRGFDHLPLGHGLPAAYGAGPDGMPRSSPPRARAEAAQLRGYLALGDALLANAGADLAALPDLFAGDLAPRCSYAARPLDRGPAGELAAGAPEDVGAIVAGLDPWHARKGRVLEYLLGLYGEEFSQNSLRLHDLYRGPTGRRDAVLENRVRLLAEVESLNRDRAGAPDLTAGQRSHSIGLGRKLMILLDFSDLGTAPLSAALPRAGLAVVEGQGPDGPWRLPRLGIPAAADPFAALVQRLDLVPAATAAQLVAETAFLAGRVIGAEPLRRGVFADAYVLAPDGDGWRLLFDPGAGDSVLDCARFADRAAACRRANQLRELFVDLNRRSEGLHLVEDVLLRGSGEAFTPLDLAVVIAGWSARTATPGFRRLAEETVALLCPAHLAHRVLWLDHPAMAAFEALQLDWRVAYRDASDGGNGLRGGDLDRAGSALRQFLASAAGRR